MPKTTHHKTLAATCYATPQGDGTWRATIEATWRDHAGAWQRCCLRLREAFPSEAEAEDSAFGEACELCSVSRLAPRLLDGYLDASDTRSAPRSAALS